jgi:DNA-binding NarL/FixJ family response regulator
LASLIRRFRPNWEVVGEAADGRQTLELAVSLSPSLIVVELSLPEVDGLTVVEHISRMLPSVSVMILTGQPIGQLVRSTRRMGARAFVSKQERPSDLLLAMDRVVSGAPFFSSAPGAPLPGPDSHAGLPSHYLLTSRELDVVRALARGNTNKQTAESLGMSVRTAESHRASIMHKLGVSSLGELVRIAVRDGIV